MRRGVVATGTTASAVALVFSFASSMHRPASLAAGTAPVGTNAASVSSVNTPSPSGAPSPKTGGTATSTPSAKAGASASSTPSAKATASPTATPTAKAAAPSARAPKAAAAPAPAAPPAAPAGVSGTFTGGTAQTAYGPVQVQIVVQNNKITSANAIKYPTGNSHDVAIAQYAIPVLDSETVQAQSANISMVSGATYTSSGYVQSLQSALSAAHL
jgi:uncharacterized protein with FMN-binding domain